MTSSDGRKLAGVVGFYPGPQKILQGMKVVKDANFRSVDAFTPFPIHGMDDAQGLKRSKLPYVTFTFGLTGVTCAFLLEYWTSAVSWPLIVGGKPFNSWPAFVPVMFELTILFAGLSTVFGMLAFNRLPNTTAKIVDPGITCDKFAIMIDAPGNSKEEQQDQSGKFKSFSEAEAEGVLKKSGATGIRKVYAEGWF